MKEDLGNLGQVAGKGHAFEWAAYALIKASPDEEAALLLAIEDVRARVDSALPHPHPEEWIFGMQLVLSHFERMLDRVRGEKKTAA